MMVLLSGKGLWLDRLGRVAVVKKESLEEKSLNQTSLSLYPSSQLKLRGWLIISLPSLYLTFISVLVLLLLDVC